MHLENEFLNNERISYVVLHNEKGFILQLYHDFG